MADELKQDEEQVVAVGADEALASDVAVDPETSTEGEAVGGETAGGDVAAAAPVNENFKWYIIHAYSGFAERKVKESLQSRVAAYHLEDKRGAHRDSYRADDGAAQREEVHDRPRVSAGVCVRGDGAGQRYVARGEEHAAGYRISADGRSAQCTLRG